MKAFYPTSSRLVISSVVAGLLAVATVVYAATEGASNNFFGTDAGAGNTGLNNSFFGGSAGGAGGDGTSGDNNSFFGYAAGFANTSGAANTFVGYEAGKANTTQGKNTFIGYQAGRVNGTDATLAFDGKHNTFVGYAAGTSNTTGDNNAFFGRDVGQSNTTGSSNAFFGGSAGFFNTEGTGNAFFGGSAGFSNTTGNRLSVYGALANVMDGLTNASAFGYAAKAEQSHAMVLGSIPGVNFCDLTDTPACDYVDVGIGVTAPMAALHVKRTDHSMPAQIMVEDTSTTTANRTLLELLNNGNARFGLENTNSGTRYEIGTTGVNGNFAVFNDGTPLFSLTNTGRFRIGTTAPAQFDSFPNGNLVIQGTLTENSDVNVKQDIEPLEGQRVLEQLEQLPVSEWAYKTDPQSRHVGPMAQDFHKAFGLGIDETKISPRDMAGVALAAIKALKAENKIIKDDHAKAMVELKAEKDAEIAELKTGLVQALQVVEDMKVRLEAVETHHPLRQAKR